MDVGDPSYTSGVHIWKGTAEILKARPTRINTIANTAPVFCLFNSFDITSKFVEPVKPYNNEHP